MHNDDYNIRHPKVARRRTMEEIAELSGVSKSTVSRALAGSEQVSPATKERIFKYAFEQDIEEQKPSNHGAIGTIAIIAPTDATMSQRMNHPFYTELTTAIIQELGMLGYSSMITQLPIWSETAVNQYFEKHDFAGCVVVGQTIESDFKNAFMLSEKVPGVVSWGVEIPNQPFVTVGSENKQSTREIVAHLLKNGRKRIAFLGNREYPEAQLRFQGYELAHQDYGLAIEPDLLIDAPPFDLKYASLIIKEFIQNGVQFDSFYATSDLLAMTAISALLEMGVKVPEDVAAVGFDDIRMASYFCPPLTTVRQNIEVGAKRLVEKLIRTINGQEVASEVLSTELVIRKSCGVIR